MILLTGASGFVGKHLLSALIQKYGAAHVVALTSQPIPGAQSLLSRNYDFNENYFQQNGFDNIETVIHAGAFTPKDGKQASDWKACNSNISNTEKLLSALPASVKRFIYLSTLDVYGNDEVVSEATAIAPISLYGYSKYYGEKMIEAWASQADKTYSILRLGHVYGPGEEAYQKIIPVTIRKVNQGDPIDIWGSGNDKRSFIFIDDVVNAIINAIDTPLDGPVNLVGSQAISIKDLVQKVMVLANSSSEIKFIPSTAPARNLIFDNSRLKQFLLSEETPLETGLLAEIAYMKELPL